MQKTLTTREPGSVTRTPFRSPFGGFFPEVFSTICSEIF